MTRQKLWRILNPFSRPGYVAPHIVVACVLLLVGAAAGWYGGTTLVQELRERHTHVLHTLTPTQQAFLLSMPMSATAAPACYVPPAWVLNLPRTYAQVESYYADEYNLIGSPVCQDSDYIQPYGEHNPLLLPGPAWVAYTYLWTGYIDGSGYYMAFETPNGGRMGYLHVYQPRSLYPGEILHGGDRFGSNGWPWALRFSNYTCSDYVSCASDSHACWISDNLGASWLYTLVYHPPAKPHPKPKPTPAFPVRLFGQYRAEHHKSAISPYDHHKLNYGALLWWHHHPQRTGGVVTAETWHPKGRHGRDGFEVDTYQAASVWWWPGHSHWKPKWVTHRWLR